MAARIGYTSSALHHIERNTLGRGRSIWFDIFRLRFEVRLPRFLCKPAGGEAGIPAIKKLRHLSDTGVFYLEAWR